MLNTLIDVPGLRVGHWTNREAMTGCTVILCGEGAVCGVDVRGGSPGTRETDLLNPTCTVDKVHAVLLAGGSAFGLAAADGVMRWLEERGIGFDVGVAKVPIVPAAILFDLLVGDAKVRPDAAAGYAACEDAMTERPKGSEPFGRWLNGNVGAGTGATVGKALGPKFAMRGGLGQASRQLDSGLVVSALAVVNAFGNVHDLQGNIIAGARNPNGVGFADPVLGMTRDSWRTVDQSTQRQNTTLAVVATNAALTKSEATKVAQMAQAGLTRVIRPVHSPLDGDVVFALSIGDVQASVSAVGMLAAEVLAEAIVRSVSTASTDGNG